MILFFDLDGTLLVDGVISERCCAALKKAKEQGHLLVLNTGRSPAFVPPAIYNDPLWDGHICGSSFVELRGEKLSGVFLDRALLKDVYDFAMEQRARVIFEGEKENFITCAPDSSLSDASVIFEREVLPAIVKVTFWCDPMNVPLDRFEGLRIVRFKSYAEGIRLGFDKSSGMEMILKRTGLSRKDTAAFGDSENDTDMLKFAGLAVAMKGAPAEFDSFCVYRAREEDGVPEALEALILK